MPFRFRPETQTTPIIGGVIIDEFYESEEAIERAIERDPNRIDSDFTMLDIEPLDETFFERMRARRAKDRALGALVFPLVEPHPVDPVISERYQ